MMLSCVLAAALMTPFGEKVTSENAWREYPRPQMVRGNWTCLNGDWDYAVTCVTNTPGRPTKWDGKIRVPFAIESRLSGVGRLLRPDEFLWYTRPISAVREPGRRVLLHFDGVDYRTMVFIGHDEVTDVPHEGGQLPFTLDITDYLPPSSTPGAPPSVLTVCVWDPTCERTQQGQFINSRGKQSLSPKGCFYTRVSGIWQSVWLETVPEKHIGGYKVVTDIDAGTVRIEVEKRGGGGEGERMELSIFAADGKKIGDLQSSTSTFNFNFETAPHLWCPDDPYLYTFKVRYGRDEVTGYFGMRKIEKRKDEKGFLRFYLNNRPTFLIGTLDQGWWPDGLLTPPSEEAMAFDIRTLKDCGYNMMRKHIKIEPLRYYYLCDKMGIWVIQDLPSGSGNWQDPIRAETVRFYETSRREMKGMMDLLQATPSVIMWNPYNEGWTQPGEFLTHAMLDFTRRHDPTRLVNGPSGCWDWEGGHLLPTGWAAWSNRVVSAHKPAGVCEAADTVDAHLYRGPAMLAANDRRISFLGEFGGLGHPVAGHLWNDASGSWGYGGIKDTATREGLEKVYVALLGRVAELAREGLGGAVYTQTTDVESEINGLMTYDRKILKFNPSVLKRVHEKLTRIFDTPPDSHPKASITTTDGVREVICWGESITEGRTVKRDETYPARLQARLGAAFKVRKSGDGTVTMSADQNAFCEIFLADANGVDNRIRRRGAGKPYLVIIPFWKSITPEQTAAFKAAFGEHAVDFRSEAIARGLAFEHLQPQAADREEIAQGFVPTGLLDGDSRNGRLNRAGCDFLAQLVYERGERLGYWRSLAATPTSRFDWSSWWAKPGYWKRRNEGARRVIRENGSKKFDIVFCGDSNTQNWEGWTDPEDIANLRKGIAEGKITEERAFIAPRQAWLDFQRDYKVLNLGISGDSTQHLLWRLTEGGLMEGYEARYFCVLIGANNCHCQGEAGEPSNIFAGIRAIVAAIRAKHPESKVILCKCTPTNRAPDHLIERRHARVNELIPLLANGKDVILCDFTAKLRNPDGTQNKQLYADGLHVNEAGFRIWSDAVRAIVR